MNMERNWFFCGAFQIWSGFTVGAELDMCFSRAELDSRPVEARLVVQSATPDLDLRD